MTDVMAPPAGDGDGTGGSIEPIDIQEEMERSFLDYAMSVIVARALPDARDGLKPVHRRILYGMYDIGARSDRPHMKCARITGDVMGKFHPHGPSAIYDALARMAQDFSLRHPLIDGHGNFGSPDHPPAAERYCVVGGSRVRTADGSPRIESLASLLPDSEADIDRKVVDHRGELVRASKLFHSGDHPTLRIRTREGYELTGTHNHPVLCLDQVAGVPMLMWHRLDELKPGMRVVLDRRPADGELGPEEPAWRIASAVADAVTAVPEFVWESDASVKREFLTLLLGVDIRGPIQYATGSESMAKDVQRLLLETGVVSALSFDDRSAAYRVVALVGDSACQPHIPFVDEYLAGVSDEEPAEVRTVIEPLVDPGLYYAEIAAVEDAGVQAVYSVRVDTDHHAFISDGFISHNTECRLALLANQMLASIDEDTVDFVDNYSGEMQEPVVLPARFPNLLVNGSQGIAVGMATNIPPHNLGEVIDATMHLLDNPEATADDLMAFIKGPDFPTGGLILGRQGILDYCRTGRGSVKMRARAEIEENKRGTYIVVSELPYQGSPGGILTKIADLVTARELEGVADVNDESAGDKTRLVVKLKRDANAYVVLNNLYKHTALQTSFGVNMVALVDGVPRTLNIAQALTAYVDHQVEVIRRRSAHRLAKAEARAHIVEGLLKALDMIDQIIALIRGSADRPAARDGLMAEPFTFTEIQANHILDMTLGRLTRLGRSDLETEMAELRETIAGLQAILGDEVRLRAVIKSELGEVREQFATPRRAEITFDPGDLGTEDLIDDEPLVFTMTRAGYVKTVAAGAFRTQGRGGRGIQGARLKEEDLVTQIVHTSAHAYLLFFSNKGRVFRLKAHEIPMKERTARGTAIVNLLSLAPTEKIQAVIDTREYDGEQFLFFATRKGRVKKTVFSEYDKSRREGFIAINLKESDELVRVIRTGGDDDIFMVSRNGINIRFSENDVRAMGRDAAGVRGMKMREGDEVVSCDVARDEVSILIVTDAGYGKRTQLDRFNRQTRGGQGVRGIKLTARKGYVVTAFMVGLDDEILCSSSTGVTMRMAVRDISSQGRDATGVRVMNLDDGATVASVAPILAISDDEE